MAANENAPLVGICPTSEGNYGIEELSVIDLQRLNGKARQFEVELQQIAGSAIDNPGLSRHLLLDVIELPEIWGFFCTDGYKIGEVCDKHYEYPDIVSAAASILIETNSIKRKGYIAGLYLIFGLLSQRSFKVYDDNLYESLFKCDTGVLSLAVEESMGKSGVFYPHRDSDTRSALAKLLNLLVELEIEHGDVLHQAGLKFGMLKDAMSATVRYTLKDPKQVAAYEEQDPVLQAWFTFVRGYVEAAHAVRG